MSEPLELQKTENGPEIEVVAKEMPADAPKPPSKDDLLAKANELGDQMRALIVEAKRLPRGKNSIAPHQDPSRALSLSQMYLQTGFMWLRKAIEVPKEF